MLHIIGMGDNVVDINVTLGQRFPGGNSVNVAIFSQYLGYRSSFMGVVGNDEEGDLVRAALNDKNVDTRYIQTKEGETGKCRIELNNGDRTITDINDLGVVRTDPLILDEEILDYIRTADLVHTACYGCMIPELHKINAIQIPILYDYSDKWTEEKLVEVAEFSTYILFSGRERPLEELEAYVRRLVGTGRCEMVICTMGKRGAMIYDGRELYLTKAFGQDVRIVDSTAAGDAFITGFITTYLLGKKHFNLFQRNPDKQIEWTLPDEDESDYHRSLVRYAINKGNMQALYTCMHEGSF